MQNSFAIAVLNFRAMAACGLDPRNRSSLPASVREHHRSLVRGVYRGEKKGYKAWRRFARVCAEEGRKLREARATFRARIDELSAAGMALVMPEGAQFRYEQVGPGTVIPSTRIVVVRDPLEASRS